MGAKLRLTTMQCWYDELKTNCGIQEHYSDWALNQYYNSTSVALVTTSIWANIADLFLQMRIEIDTEYMRRTFVYKKVCSFEQTSSSDFVLFHAVTLRGCFWWWWWSDCNKVLIFRKSFTLKPDVLKKYLFGNGNLHQFYSCSDKILRYILSKAYAQHRINFNFAYISGMYIIQYVNVFEGGTELAKKRFLYASILNILRAGEKD